jgi:hypothetical protein
VYRPYPEPRIYDVTFVGQRYADRAEFLDHLHRNGVRVRAWGAGWRPSKRLDIPALKSAWALLEDEHLDGLQRILRRRLSRRGEGSPAQAACIDTSPYGAPRLPHRAFIQLFSQSHISLGFATAGDSHNSQHRLTHLRLREFEAPMSGALYLTEHQAELGEYFAIGTEVITYTDRQDLLEKVTHYLAHPEQAERIRRAGYARARRDHTWQHRFNELFAALGLEHA